MPLRLAVHFLGRTAATLRLAARRSSTRSAKRGPAPSTRSLKLRLVSWYIPKSTGAILATSSAHCTGPLQPRGVRFGAPTPAAATSGATFESGLRRCCSPTRSATSSSVSSKRSTSPTTLRRE
eukprot:2596897-Prymnesium_polylepis.3